MTISWKNTVWLSVALLNPPLVKADDTSFNVQFIGTIVGESCNVDTNSAEQTIDLGEFTIEEFPRVGATTPEKQFAITLKNCTRAIGGTTVWFTGDADANDPTLLALSDTGKGTQHMMATGLAVELLDSARASVPINNTESPLYPLLPGDNTLTFFLRYKSTLPT
ncbi:fimbrial protein, partial [Enterobacter hormaechei subsp. steigerwaltii]|uniref:fimbrial protein n=2 Tax=Enterobacter TaxID=547 RepID=UPI000D765814